MAAIDLNLLVRDYGAGAARDSALLELARELADTVDTLLLQPADTAAVLNAAATLDHAREVLDAYAR